MPSFPHRQRAHRGPASALSRKFPLLLFCFPAALCSHAAALAPEAIPGALLIPLRCGFEVSSAGRQMLAHYLFVEGDAQAWTIGNIDPAMIDDRCLHSLLDERRPPWHIQRMVLK